MKISLTLIVSFQILGNLFASDLSHDSKVNLHMRRPPFKSIMSGDECEGLLAHIRVVESSRQAGLEEKLEIVEAVLRRLELGRSLIDTE